MKIALISLLLLTAAAGTAAAGPDPRDADDSVIVFTSFEQGPAVYRAATN